MIHFLSGNLALKGKNFVVIETHGVGYKIFVSDAMMEHLQTGVETKLFCYFYMKEDGISLYGFLNSEDLELFEMLNSVSGVGPKTALGIMNLTATPNLLAAIKEGRVLLLTKASGIGRKTAERLILELKEKIKSHESKDLIGAMESDADVLGALINLGYGRSEAKEALRKIDPAILGIPARLKEALKLLKR
ncbi:MAG: Holliday junction branch migration protein RuvA [Candidatus Liptonbacteria bacterium]|nr:Holliday junction branch migration protein RuvA [Candidatus Liptonbacteria bacterium]